jgi:glycosyltransferase involved in cell wall biosynthesis
MPIRLCINTQTPPIQPLVPIPSDPDAVWKLGRDYETPAGGVVPMMRALLAEGQGRWLARPTTWVALGALGLPQRARLDGSVLLELLDLPASDRVRYTRFKEAIWRSFHGPRGFRPSIDDYPAFVRYSADTALRLLGHARDHDLFYIHDFQQVLIGGLIGSSAPTLLRWHIPLDFRGYPEPVRRFFLKAMEGFDGIVVSTRAGLEDLIGAGFQGRAFQVYPYFDPKLHTRAEPKVVAELEHELKLGRGPVVLSVGRMDPVKRQDEAIRAIARVRRSFPEVKLLLVGGEGFTSRGLGSKKAEGWRAQLEALARRLRVSDSVVFAGSLSPSMLAAAYDAADVFVHPAPYEGFGLVVVEAWTHGRPVVVSRGAGSAELVEDGYNGYVIPPRSSGALAGRIEHLLRHPEAAAKMGEAGRHTAARCHVDRAAPRMREIFERTIELYGRSRPRGAPRGR